MGDEYREEDREEMREEEREREKTMHSLLVESEWCESLICSAVRVCTS